jgi:hypothetical protein
MPQLVQLSRSYTATVGAPTIGSVDASIFTRRYFAHCMACTFCHDACCAHGVDVDDRVATAILEQAERIEAVVGVPRNEWFTGPAEPDVDAPGGAIRRTAVRDGYCVFHDPQGRGCLLHAYALASGQDYHDLKPIVSTLFPVTFGDGALLLSEELEDGTLVCAGEGPTAYAAARPELAHYFGDGFVRELDYLATTAPPNASVAPLPVTVRR